MDRGIIWEILSETFSWSKVNLNGMKEHCDFYKWVVTEIEEIKNFWPYFSFITQSWSKIRKWNIEK